MNHYRALIQTLDQPAGLVEIQAQIIDVDLNFSRDIGVDWRGKYPDRVQGSYLSDSDVRVPEARYRGDAGLSLTTMVGNAAMKFLARIRALEEDGHAQTLARPTVLTLENVEAQLEHSQTFFIRIAGQEEVDLFPVTVGVVLRVIPHHIEDEGQSKIKMAIRVEDGALTNQTVDSIPVVNRTAINTQAMIGIDESLLIGGYILEEELDMVDRVPGLGSVPVIKHAFRHKRKRTRKRERLFLITPRLVTPGTFVPTNTTVMPHSENPSAESVTVSAIKKP